ncbi:hypothetical protein AN1V17_39650 [Vallitalea sediminicola]
MDDVKLIKSLLDECKIDYGVDNDEEIGLRSIQLVMLVAWLEDAFNIEIPDDYLEVPQLNSITKIVNVVRSLNNE